MPVSLLVKKLSRFGIDGFLLAIFSAIIIAYLLPAPGLMTAPVSLEEIANYGIAFIFFFYGLKLNPGKLRSGLSNWKMHLLIQSATFLVFPLLILLFKPLFLSQQAHPFWLGFFFLAALPSTVSSSVVMVSIAKGNTPAAIFNASISSLLGIFITPLWVALFINTGTTPADSSSILLKLLVQVLLPVSLGLFLNKYLGSLAEKNKTALKIFDQSVIVLIVYTSFCHSFADNIFQGISFITLLLLIAGAGFLFFIIFSLLSFFSAFFGFSHADKITVLFCGSKKSLVHGSVMLKIIFQGSAISGILLLPLMIYHAIQLILASIIAQKWAHSSPEER